MPTRLTAAREDGVGRTSMRQRQIAELEGDADFLDLRREGDAHFLRFAGAVSGAEGELEFHRPAVAAAPTAAVLLVLLTVGVDERGDLGKSVPLLEHRRVRVSAEAGFVVV